MNAHRTTLIVLTMAGVAAGCLPQSPAAAAVPDACALLTEAEVSAALGVAVDPGERTMPTETRFCTWREHGKDEREARNVRISFLSAQDFKGGKPSHLAVGSTSESGIGDEAYFSKATGMVFLLSVRKGDIYFRVQARSSAGTPTRANTPTVDRKDQEIDRTLARTLLQKLL
jgi:hypothetical protein